MYSSFKQLEQAIIEEWLDYYNYNRIKTKL
ncbi:TPA: hypothetical protein ACHU8X_002618 [Enterococcus faecalis]